MNKLDKKSTLIIAVLLVNIVFITIPYTMKNMNIENNIRRARVGQKQEETVDVYSAYDNFSAILDELKIVYDYKRLDVSSDGASITIGMKTNIMSMSNFLIYINKKIPSMSVKSARISSDDKQLSEVVFFVGQ